jgi:dolichol-phosphate mannosyltransferase
MRNPRISIVIPTYNEVQCIRQTISSVQAVLGKTPYEILVVDDRSTDGTKDVLMDLSSADPRVRYIARNGTNADLGKSILLGIRSAKGRVVIGMDADGNHDPRLLPALIASLDQHDVAIGSRYVRGGGIQSTFRYITSYSVNRLLGLLLRTSVRDMTSGYYAMRRELLTRLPLSEIYYGYGEYHIRLMFYLQKSGMKIHELPAFFPERKYGKSKSKFFRMFVTYMITASRLSRIR